MKLFRIYCEDVDRELMEKILQEFLNGYTITPAMGFYEGVREQSVVIDVFDTTEEVIQLICKKLAEALHQKSVAYVSIPLYIAK